MINYSSLPGYQSLLSSIARESLPVFIRQSWNIIEPSTSLSWNWHLDAYSEVYTAISRSQLKRVIINVPPGAMKSLFAVFWNSWEWVDHPELRYLTASFTDDNTIRDNLKVRDIVSSEWYASNFWSSSRVTLNPHESGKEKFSNTAKGFRIATSVGGRATGEHPHRIIIDDPLKAQERNSEVKLKACIDWWKNTISTRMMLDPAIIVIMQRLHEDDLAGYLLSQGGWEHVCFPMRFQSRKTEDKDIRNIPDPRDRRTVEGELLWPDKWGEDKVSQEERDLGEFGRAGQLGQNPIPEGGGLFKRDWFDIVDEVPLDLDYCRGWDIAETDEEEHKKDSNYTSGVKIGRSRSTGDYYVVDDIHERISIVDNLIKNTAKSDGKKCRIREGSGSGKATTKARAKLLEGYDYGVSPEHESKIQRAKPFRSMSEGRNVKLKRAPWNEDWLSEICSFPVGKFDDRVDASSNAFNELATEIKKLIKATVGS
jgi:predicted phage terminase large subunit-like protein